MSSTSGTMSDFGCFRDRDKEFHKSNSTLPFCLHVKYVGSEVIAISIVACGYGLDSSGGLLSEMSTQESEKWLKCYSTTLFR
jgi:hypothetical protein